MSIRSNLETPGTRAPTIAVLISCALAVAVVVTLLVSLPAISTGTAGGLMGWALPLLAAAIVAIVISSVFLTRRASR